MTEQLPPILYIEHVRAALPHLSERAAQRAIKRGDLGPYAKIAGRLVLRRDTFLTALAKEGTR